MRIAEILLKRRLKKIRSDLDFYLNSNSRKKESRRKHTLLSNKKLCDDIDYLEEQEDCFSEALTAAPQSAPSTESAASTVAPENPLQIPQYQAQYRPNFAQSPDQAQPQIMFSQRPDIDKILEQKEETFSTMLLRLIDEKGLKDSEVYKRANIDRRLFSKIRGDEDYVPSKKTAIAFCLALQLGMGEAKKLLESAGYTLSASSRFDLIIMYLIENREYNIHFANIVLDDYGEGSLSR